MSGDERYDIVVIGGGPNGMTTAAYLAKCNLSVCVLEERTECGGACETVEPIPGVRIFPHAILMYASPAPGFEQLELHKYGVPDELGSDESRVTGQHGSDLYRRLQTYEQQGHGRLGQAGRYARFSTVHEGAVACHLLVPSPPP